MTFCETKNKSYNFIFETLSRLKWNNPDLNIKIKFYDPTIKDLGEIATEKILDIENHLKNYIHYFNFIMVEYVDIRHYFLFINIKTECIFWPYIFLNEKIINLIFYNEKCPIVKQNNEYFVLYNRETLKNPLEMKSYNNLQWFKILPNDLFRFIYSKWVEKIFKSIIFYIDNNDFYRMDKLIIFINFWSNENKVLGCIREAQDEIVFHKFVTFDSMHTSFSNLIKNYGSNREKWDGILRSIKNNL